MKFGIADVIYSLALLKKFRDICNTVEVHVGVAMCLGPHVMKKLA